MIDLFNYFVANTLVPFLCTVAVVGFVVGLCAGLLSETYNGRDICKIDRPIKILVPTYLVGCYLTKKIGE